MNMIERVARAIDPRAFDDDYQNWFFFKCWQDQAAEKAMKQARAAIEAMREPTYSMKAAASRIPHARDDEIYQAMINATLTP